MVYCTGGTVEENGLNNTLVCKQQHKVGATENALFLDGRQSLLAVFVDVTGVLLKTYFFVQGDSEICEALIMGYTMGTGRVDSQSFCF